MGPETETDTGYSTLNLENYDIRVLDLSPADHIDDPIVCSLRTVSLNDKPEYETLSYTWGDQLPSHPVTIDNKQQLVTLNLADALRHLRHREKVVILWADAICINQADDAEKGHQVLLMRKVFQQTTKAHIWLGKFSKESCGDDIEKIGFKPTKNFSPHDWKNKCYTVAVSARGRSFQRGDDEASASPPGTASNPFENVEAGSFSDGLAILEMLASGMHFYEMPFYTSGGDREALVRWWTAFDVLTWIVSRPWWFRVWTLQEAVLPSVDSIVHVGHHEIKLSVILRASVQYFRHEALENCCAGLAWIMSGCAGRDMRKLFLLVDSVQRSQSQLEKNTEGPGINVLTKMSSGRNAKDPRDYFYGILGLMQKSVWAQGYTHPSYNTDVSMVYCEVTKLVFKSDRSLIRLSECVGLSPQNPYGIPSWATNISEDLTAHRLYRFDADLGLDSSFTYATTDLSSKELRVEGVRADKITYSDYEVLTEEREMRNNAPFNEVIALIREKINRYHSLVKTLNGWEEDYSDDFWRIMFQDRKPAEKTGRRMTAKDLDARRQWFNTLGLPPADWEYDTFPGLFFDYNDGFKFFCTEKKQAGLGRAELQGGDEIWIVKGVPAPVILRKTEKPLESGEETYQILGLCYCSNIMDGEAIDDGKNGPFKQVVLV